MSHKYHRSFPGVKQHNKWNQMNTDSTLILIISMIDGYQT